MVKHQMLADPYQIMVAPDADTCQTMVMHQMLAPIWSYGGTRYWPMSDWCQWWHTMLTHIRLWWHQMKNYIIPNANPYYIAVAIRWWFTSDYGGTKCWSISSNYGSTRSSSLYQTGEGPGKIFYSIYKINMIIQQRWHVVIQTWTMYRYFFYLPVYQSQAKFISCQFKWSLDSCNMYDYVPNWWFSQQISFMKDPSTIALKNTGLRSPNKALAPVW